MGLYRLLLHDASIPSGALALVVSARRNARIYGGAEPWVEVNLADGESTVDGTTATQPLSCLQAVGDGRKTALMCGGGILALQKQNGGVLVSFHGTKGQTLRAFAKLSDYEKLISTIADSV